MNILVTNDDGIESPGIWQLATAMNRLGNTIVVAPDKEQSAAGTGVSLRDNVTVNEFPSSIPGIKAYAVSGTPNDCVNIGLRLMREQRIHLLVSGINNGPNCGRDIPHSGTVMATLPGYIRKIPSIAVSLAMRRYGDEPRFDVAALVAESIAEKVIEGLLPTEGIININVPSMVIEEIKGILVTKAAPSGYTYQREKNPDGRYTFRIGKSVTPEMMEGTDIMALESGYVSVTPLRLEVTHYDLMPHLREGIEAVENKLMGKP